MAEDIPSLEQSLRRLEAANIDNSIKALASRMGSMGAQLDTLQKEVSEIKEYADRWKGGFYAITGLGAFLGGVIAIWDKIPKPWGH